MASSNEESLGVLAGQVCLLKEAIDAMREENVVWRKQQLAVLMTLSSNKELLTNLVRRVEKGEAQIDALRRWRYWMTGIFSAGIGLLEYFRWRIL